MGNEARELSVRELVTGQDDYAIPLYQRNFAWTFEEIEQLVNDVADAQKARDNYYIGTLVVTETADNFQLIDGQQRTTALNLICLALKNDYDIAFSNWNAPRLHFQARQKSEKNLERLFKQEAIPEEAENEISQGYARTQQVLEKVFQEPEFESAEAIHAFTDYLLNQVKIFRNVLPDSVDLNLYFERFNSRGVQLEAHEIIKANMMDKFPKDQAGQAKAQQFAKIWDACADFDRPVIQAFKKKTKRSHSDSEREKIFPVAEDGYFQFKPKFSLQLDDDLSQIDINENSKKSLLSAIASTNDTPDNRQHFADDEVINYTTVTNFETFLFYAYYITFGNVAPQYIILDDKKLLTVFETVTGDQGSAKDVIAFAKNLLTLKFIFDNLIVRMAKESSGNGRRKEDEWFLQRVSRSDINQKSGAHRYVQYSFEKNSFKYFNKEISLLQSMFAVTFTANRDSRWLYEILQYLFERKDDLHKTDFGPRFKDFLEEMAVRFAKPRIFSENRPHQIKSYQEKVPVYAFNVIDYVLWTNREALKETYKDVNFNDFKFAYRRSIEHWYPQHPNGGMEQTVLDREHLHSIGNLGIITDGQNSRFGNEPPEGKLGSWRSIFDRQSLKLQMIAQITQKEGWGSTQITAHAVAIETLVNDFIATVEEKISE